MPLLVLSDIELFLSGRNTELKENRLCKKYDCVQLLNTIVSKLLSGVNWLNVMFLLQYIVNKFILLFL